MLSLGLGLTVLVATALIEGNLREQITQRIPKDAPAFFFVDIQSSQIAEFEKTIAAVPGGRQARGGAVAARPHRQDRRRAGGPDKGAEPTPAGRSTATAA
jgi:predicted lysophospholipase L1 biosynthesis ABC-type transport system permease subunit